MLAFSVRNASDLLAFATDTATGKLGRRVPPLRVLFAVEPDRAAYVENDAIVTCVGAWTCPDPRSDPPIPVGGVPAVAAFPGPVAVPARFFADEADEHVLHVPSGLLELVASDDPFDLGVVVDAYGAPGPAAKRGTLVRGRGRLVRADRDFVTIDPRRVTDWDGVDTTTAGVADLRA
jgi:hypothetical protein